MRVDGVRCRCSTVRPTISGALAPCMLTSSVSNEWLAIVVASHCIVTACTYMYTADKDSQLCPYCCSYKTDRNIGQTYR